MDRVVVVTGAGGIGTAVARRLGLGTVVLLADTDPVVLAATTARLRGEGLTIEPIPVDVSSADSVVALAGRAMELGRITEVVHTAGVTPVQASPSAIVGVDVLGTTHMLDTFGLVVDSGGAGVCIASMAGSMTALEPDVERRLALTPTDRLAELPELSADALADPARPT